jgi:hypothetical protein
MTTALGKNRSLQKLNPQILEMDYRELPFDSGLIVPIETTLKAGIPSVRQLVFNEYGKADYLSDQSKSMPLVDASASFDEYAVHGVWSGYTERFFEQLTQSNNSDISYARTILQLQKTANRAIAELSNKYLAYGEAKLGVTGFINNANVTVEDTTFNAYTATPQAIFQYFVDIQDNQWSGSNYTNKPMDLVVSPTLHTLLVKTKSEENDNSVKTRLLTRVAGQEPIYRSINEAPELLFNRLEANGVLTGGTNKDRIVIYDRDPDAVCSEVEAQTIKMIPQKWMAAQTLTKIYGMYHLMTEVQWKNPTTARYINLLKKP